MAFPRKWFTVPEQIKRMTLVGLILAVCVGYVLAYEDRVLSWIRNLKTKLASVLFGSGVSDER
jgi:hypothetical protein